MWQPPLFQMVVDKGGNIVRFYRGMSIRAASFIHPFRVPWPMSLDEPRKHNGGRAEFKPDRDYVYWRERSRKYETWYHNPWTGETWGWESVPKDGHWDEAALIRQP